MWLQTTLGSFSINQTEADRSVGMLTVASHSRHDIEAYVSRFMPPHGVVQYDDKSAEFQFSIRAPQANVAVTIAAAVSDIYYNDFIGAVQQTQGNLRTKCYYGVASQLSSIQYQNNEYDPGNQVPEGIEPEKILEIGCEGGSFTIWR